MAPDSFKGSLTSFEVIQAVQEAAQRIDTTIEIIGIPVADGGEGTLDTLIHFHKCKKIDAVATDPLGRKISAYFGLMGTTAVVELAVVSGLTKLSPVERNPLYTTSFGTGELILRALELPQVKEIVVAIGGSATVDGGIGLGQALGLRALDCQGRDLPFGGYYLSRLERLVTNKMHCRLKDIRIRVACDVNNPLCGRFGAAYVYGPQKGATGKAVEELDQNLRHLANVIQRDLGVDVLNLPGAGAAGGVGAGMVAFCGADLQPGADLILELLEFDKYLPDVDLVVTGEGMTDFQTAFGKTPMGVSRKAKRFEKPVICLSGSLGQGYKKLYKQGFDAFFSISPGPIDTNDSIVNAYKYLIDAAEDIIRLYRTARKE